MTDRELLEAAAKAAGFAEASWQDLSGWGEVRYGLSEAIWTGEDYWNPIASDADALRLAVKLFLREAVRDGYQHVDSDNDFYAATRRAITRAAAALAPA